MCGIFIQWWGAHVHTGQSPLLSPPPVPNSLGDLLSGGVYHILPSFFKMMIVLCERGVDFRILFRTFGADSANVGAHIDLLIAKHKYSTLRRFFTFTIS